MLYHLLYEPCIKDPPFFGGRGGGGFFGGKGGAAFI
jgi:hypothetical protein